MDFGRFSDLTTDLRISKDHLAHKGQLFLFSMLLNGLDTTQKFTSISFGQCKTADIQIQINIPGSTDLH